MQTDYTIFVEKGKNMASVKIDIDGYIGNWGCSRQFVKEMLKDAGSDPVDVTISSLGGDINHGLGIHDLFVDNKNVTCRLTGFVASAATVIACGAKKVRMNSTAFYLIHKVSGWVDEWGYMNEDELQQLIESLAQKQEENKKIDLVIAQIYAAKTGKPLNEIADLMKKEVWLTAQEALDWGFVNEVVDMSGKENFVIDNVRVAMLHANNLPIPPRQSNNGKGANSNEGGTNATESAINKLTATINNLFNNNSKTTAMDKTKYAPILAAMAIDAISADKDGNVVISASQFDVLNAMASELVNVKQERDNANQALATEKTEKENATTQLQTTTSSLNALVESINGISPEVKTAETNEAKIAAIVAKIAKKPGASNTGNNGGDNGTEDAQEDWDTINNLPHNRAADEVL
jgi:ATP-dependent Clp protease, protease subunit